MERTSSNAETADEGDSVHHTCEMLDTSLPCKFPSNLPHLMGMRLGMTCQELFAAAYTAAGQPDSYGRAMFVAYIGTEASAVPPAVLRFCERLIKQPSGIGRCEPITGKCMGCQTSPEKWRSLISAYGGIHPEVTAESLHDDRPYKPRLPAAATQPGPTYQDKLFTELFGSMDADAFEDTGWEE